MISLSSRPARRTRRFCGALALLLALACALPAYAQDGTVSVVPTSTPLPVVGVPFTLDLAFDIGAAPTSAALFYRATGSGSAYSTITASPTSDPDTLSVSVPGSIFDPAGIDFYVEYVVNGETTTLPEIDPEMRPLQLPVVSAAVQAPTFFRPRQYQMVTVPVQFLPRDVRAAINGTARAVLPDFLPLRNATSEPTAVFEDLGEYAEESWRILRWNPLSETYRSGPLEVDSLQVGRSYWVISASGGGFGVESVLPAGFVLPPLSEFGSFVLQSQPIEVVLQPGWNQIGSPYLFPVAWDEVEGSALVNAPVASVGGEYEGEQDVLEPWVGYFVENPTLDPVTLRFTVPGTPPGDQLAFAQRLLDRAGTGAFLLQIRTDELTEDGADGNAARQTRNTFAGVGQQALRLKSPPPISGGPHLQLRGEDGQAFSSAIAPRTTDASGAAWTLDLRADDSWTRPRQFEVRLDEHGRRPAGWSYRLADAATGEPVVLSGDAFRVSLGPGETRRFRLTLGPDAALGIDAPASSAPLFGRVGPNPVPRGQAVEVRYRTPGGAGEIVVLDLLGRAVHRIAAETPPGWHEAVWDGRTPGGAVAPGLYLLHLRTPAGQAVRKLTVLQ